MSQEYKEELNRVRGRAGRASSAVKKVRDNIKTAVNVFSVTKQIDFSRDWSYFLAEFAAMGKDVLDFAIVGALPAIGTAITLCVSIFIGMMMFFASFGGKGKIAKSIGKKIGVLIAGTIAEAFLFGLNFLPIESITVIVIYVMALIERAREAENE